MRARLNEAMWAGALAGLTWGLASCGGSAPPPQSPAAAPPSEPSAEASAEPTPEPAASPDLVRGIKAFDAGHTAEARAAFEAASSTNPKNYEALYDLGMACEKLGDKAAAETAYRSALTAKPDLETASAALTALLLDEGRNDDAVTAAHAGLGAHPRSAALHEDLGVALATAGDRDGAQKELEQAVHLAPSDPLMELTLAHWLSTWHVPGAGPHLDNARTLAKGDVPMLLSVGLEYRVAGDFAACVKTYDDAIAIQDGGEARTERALCRLGSKDDAGALDDLQKAVSVEPTYAPAHYYLAGRLAKTGHFDEAAAEYAKVVQLAPSGSLAKMAAERMKAAKDAAAKSKKKH